MTMTTFAISPLTGKGRQVHTGIKDARIAPATDILSRGPAPPGAAWVAIGASQA